MMALEMMKHKNFLLEKSNEDLSLAAMSTMSPLQDRQDSGRLTHSTTSLVIVCLIILVLGLVNGHRSLGSVEARALYTLSMVRCVLVICAVPGSV